MAPSGSVRSPLERTGHPADGPSQRSRRRRDVGPFSLRQPAVTPTYSPTPPSPRDRRTRARSALSSYTVDVSDPEQWRYCSFTSGAWIANPGAKDWDLAFRRLPDHRQRWP